MPLLKPAERGVKTSFPLWKPFWAVRFLWNILSSSEITDATAATLTSWGAAIAVWKEQLHHLLLWMFAVNLPYEINPKKDFMCSVLMRSAVIHDIYTIKSSLSLYPPPTKWRRPTDWFNILTQLIVRFTEQILTNFLRHVSLMSLAAVSLIHIVWIWETETLRVQTIWYPYQNAETSDVSSLADCESDRLSCKLKVTVWVHVSS